jgi:hypothetical protein
MTRSRAAAAVGALATAALGIVLSVAAAAPAAGQEPAEPQSSEAPATQPDAAAQLEFIDQTTWVGRGDAFRVEVAVNHAPPGVRLQLVVHERLTSRSAFTATFDGILGPTRATPVAEPLDALPMGPGNGRELAFSVGDGGVSFDQAGVYPVEVLLTDETGTAVDNLITYLLLLPDGEDFPPLGVAVVMEIGAAPGLKPDGSVQVRQDELAQIGARAEALLSAPDLPATVAPIPETLDALAHSDPPPPVLNDLDTALEGREVLARPYVDIDLEVSALAGLVGEATSSLEAGRNVIRSRYGGGREPTIDIWLTGETVSAREAAIWRDRGIERAVVPPSAVAAVPDLPDGALPAGTVSLPADGASQGQTAFVSDQALVDHLLGNGGRLDAQRFLSELTMIWFERPADPRGVVVRIPDQEPLDPDLVAWAFGRLNDTTALRPVSLTELFDTVPPADGDQPPLVELTPKDITDDLSWMADPLDRGRRTWAGLAESINDPDLVNSLQRSLLIAPGARTDDEDRRAYISRVNAAAHAIAGTVSAPPEFRITLTAREGTIPLTISNTSDQIVAVRVHLDSPQLEFPDGEQLDIDVPPEGVRVDLRVRTRTSGAFPLNITLTTPDGSVTLDETTFDIRSTAVSGVGLVLSLGAGLFLLVWWTRHWRSSRRNGSIEQPDTGTAAGHHGPEGVGSTHARSHSH